MKSPKSSRKSTLPPLLHLSYVLQHKAEQVLEVEVGTGLSAVRIMSVLDKSATTSQRVIAMELHQTESNVSRQLQIMRKHGLVNISRNKKDSRQRDITLTTKGVKRYQHAEKLLKKQQTQFLRILNSGETKAFESAAEKLG